MSEPAADVSTPVEYSRDKWLLDRLPWALWMSVVGLAFVLHTGEQGTNAALLAFLYVAMLGLAFAGWAASSLIFRSASFVVGLVLTCAVAFLVTVVILRVVGSVGRSTARGTLWWSRLVDPPPQVFGWMLIYFGCAYVAYALFRHYYPGRPIVMLSQSGVSFHRPWLRDVFIPWQDIQAVGPLETSSAGSHVTTHPLAIVVVVTDDFYKRNIAPKRSFFSPPGSESMFRPRGAAMQMILNNPELVVAPEDFRAPIEARWRAFRHGPVSPLSSSGPTGKSIVYGRWSIDGSWWQVIKYLAPLAGAAGVVLHASGFT